MCPAPERPEGPGRTGPSGTGGMEHRMARTPLGDFVSTPSRGLETTPGENFFSSLRGWTDQPMRAMWEALGAGSNAGSQAGRLWGAVGGNETGGRDGQRTA